MSILVQTRDPGACKKFRDVSGITPYDRLLRGAHAAARIWNPMCTRGAATLDAEVTRQAQIIAFNDDYHLYSVRRRPAFAAALCYAEVSQATAAEAD